LADNPLRIIKNSGEILLISKNQQGILNIHDKMEMAYDGFEEKGFAPLTLTFRKDRHGNIVALASFLANVLHIKEYFYALSLDKEGFTVDTIQDLEWKDLKELGWKMGHGKTFTSYFSNIRSQSKERNENLKTEASKNDEIIYNKESKDVSVKPVIHKASSVETKQTIENTPPNQLNSKTQQEVTKKPVKIITLEEIKPEKKITSEEIKPEKKLMSSEEEISLSSDSKKKSKKKELTTKKSKTKKSNPKPKKKLQPNPEMTLMIVLAPQIQLHLHEDLHE